MPHDLYPDDLAEVLKPRAGEKWRPSNGSEGEAFIESWCMRCSRDGNEDCPILAATFAYPVDDPAYPSQWQLDPRGQPVCTAWLDLDDPPKHVCTKTGDLFP